jgi:hypothetical protein
VKRDDAATLEDMIERPQDLNIVLPREDIRRWLGQWA